MLAGLRRPVCSVANSPLDQRSQLASDATGITPASDPDHDGGCAADEHRDANCLHGSVGARVSGTPPVTAVDDAAHTPAGGVI